MLLKLNNFNPRSREGSDVKITKIEHNGKISIHAPAKGATKRNIAVEPVELHFNPRSREGSDYRLENWKQNFQKFQSTLPRRERQKAL